MKIGRNPDDRMRVLRPNKTKRFKEPLGFSQKDIASIVARNGEAQASANTALTNNMKWLERHMHIQRTGKARVKVKKETQPINF